MTFLPRDCWPIVSRLIIVRIWVCCKQCTAKLIYVENNLFKEQRTQAELVTQTTPTIKVVLFQNAVGGRRANDMHKINLGHLQQSSHCLD